MNEGRVSSKLKNQINIALAELMDSSEIVLCTCSSIAQAAQDLGKTFANAVIRVDRPMAEKAVRAKRLAVIATIESTLPLTKNLLTELTQELGLEPVLSIELCDAAWKNFASGEQEKFVKQIACCVDEMAKSHDMIVLAQASMAGAIAFCKTNKRVLASPELAVDYCLAKLFS